MSHETELELTDDERSMLIHGLLDWGGPAYGSESLAIAMGFSGLDDLEHDAERIIAILRAGQPLSVRDWTRALFSTELIFASDVIGTGDEWTVIQGGRDADWIDVLRRLQRKVPHAWRFLGP